MGDMGKRGGVSMGGGKEDYGGVELIVDPREELCCWGKCDPLKSPSLVSLCVGTVAERRAYFPLVFKKKENSNFIELIR